uniref:Uncharacterized protein n=1 Tax=Salix viminalis TaxID=40686 RepID=A0A6N2M860_SALVM
MEFEGWAETEGVVLLRAIEEEGVEWRGGDCGDRRRRPCVSSTTKKRMPVCPTGEGITIAIYEQHITDTLESDFLRPSNINLFDCHYNNHGHDNPATTTKIPLPGLQQIFNTTTVSEFCMVGGERGVVASLGKQCFDF